METIKFKNNPVLNMTNLQRVSRSKEQITKYL